MTSQAWQSLSAELEQLAEDVARPGPTPVQDAGLVRLPVVQGERRLAALRAVAESADVVTEAGVAAIGRRATLRETDGEVVAYSIVFPSDGDPRRGWISADSPLGAAILGARAGETVTVFAPAGTRRVSVLAVE